MAKSLFEELGGKYERQGHYHTEKKIDRVEIMFGNFDVFYGGGLWR